MEHIFTLVMTHALVAAAAYVFGHHKGSGFMLQQLERLAQREGLDR